MKSKNDPRNYTKAHERKRESADYADYTETVIHNAALECDDLASSMRSQIHFSQLESIRPIPYRPNPTGAPEFWRCAHFHLVAICPGYQPLVTEIHFQGDPKKNDPMFRPENAIVVKEQNSNGKVFQSGVFDVVLEREGDSK